MSKKKTKIIFAKTTTYKQIIESNLSYELIIAYDVNRIKANFFCCKLAVSFYT